FKDPNPLVAANNTPELLQAKGIKVLHYPLEEVDAFYQSYQHWTLTKMPRVTVKLAQSLDAKVASANDQRCYLSNAECSKFTHINRLHSDVILTTAQTINLDDPLLNVRLEGKEYSKVLAIIDSHLSMNNEANIFKTATHCHIYHNE